MLGDRELAADAVQEALFRAWRAFPRLPQDANVAAWLTRIAQREALRQWRRDSRPHPGSESEGSWAVEPEAAASARAEREAVRNALSGLAATQREVLRRHYGDGWLVRQVATRLGLPEGTVKSHLHRGRAALRLTLLQEGVIEMPSAPEAPSSLLQALVQQLETAGTIGSPVVAAALRAVPRHPTSPPLLGGPPRPRWAVGS